MRCPSPLWHSCASAESLHADAAQQYHSRSLQCIPCLNLLTQRGCGLTPPWVRAMLTCASAETFPFGVQVEEVLCTVLLPGMMLTPAMPAVCNEVWALLKTMPYTTRYRLYVQLRVMPRCRGATRAEVPISFVCHETFDAPRCAQPFLTQGVLPHHLAVLLCRRRPQPRRCCRQPASWRPWR